MSRIVTPPLSQPSSIPQHGTPQEKITIPQEKIAMRAYEKWIKRGRPEGTEMLDWLEAENELKTEMSRSKSAGKY